MLVVIVNYVLHIKLNLFSICLITPQLKHVYTDQIFKVKFVWIQVLKHEIKATETHQLKQLNFRFLIVT